MIAKIGSGRDFGGLVRYLIHGRGEDAAPDRVAWVSGRNLPSDDPGEAAIVMRASANLNERVHEPVYHVSISLPPGERLSRAQWEGAADRVLHELGLSEHQTLVVAHGDTAHAHVHLVVNRVHPDSGAVWSRWQDRARIQASLRDIEREQGLVVVPSGRSPHALPQGVVREWERTGRPPLLEYARQVMPGALNNDVMRGWSDFHHHLNALGLFLERKGQGLVVTDDVRQVKASAVGREFSLRGLEARLGPFQNAPNIGLKASLAIRDEKCLTDLQARLRGVFELRRKLSQTESDWQYGHAKRYREAWARLTQSAGRAYRDPEQVAERVREIVESGRAFTLADWDRIGRLQGVGLGPNIPLTRAREAASIARPEMAREIELFRKLSLEDRRYRAEMDSLRQSIAKLELRHRNELAEFQVLSRASTERQQELARSLRHLRPRDFAELETREPGYAAAAELPGWRARVWHLAQPPEQSPVVSRMERVLSRHGVSAPQGDLERWLRRALAAGVRPEHAVQASAQWAGVMRTGWALQAIARGQNPLYVVGQMTLRAAGVPPILFTAVRWVVRAAEMLTDRGSERSR